jgi:fused signal recognition particle receptor
MAFSLFGKRDTPPEDKQPEAPRGLFDRMKQAVTRTRESLAGSISSVIALTREVDDASLDDLEFALLAADIGSNTTNEIIARLRERALRQGIANGAELKVLLKAEILRVLKAVDRPLTPVNAPPEVIMMVGVNGAGKTTTSGKLAAMYRRAGHTVLLCAADTFRAAAILHTKTDLMKELDKMRRTAEKIIPGAPHQTLLVIDATTGQNGLPQARIFTEASRVTGIVLTKLDGSAKGGIVVAIAHELGLPVRYAGVGEKLEDIIPFDATSFVDSLLD